MYKDINKLQLTFQQFYGFCQNLKPRVVRPGGGGGSGGGGGGASRPSGSTSCSASSLRWTFVTKSESHSCAREREGAGEQHEVGAVAGAVGGALPSAGRGSPTEPRVGSVRCAVGVKTRTGRGTPSFAFVVGVCSCCYSLYYGANATKNITLQRSLAGPGGTGVMSCRYLLLLGSRRCPSTEHLL